MSTILAMGEFPPEGEYPVFTMDLGFGDQCRKTCSGIYKSACGMIENGFIGQGGLAPSQRVVASLSLTEYSFDTYLAAVRKEGNSNAVREMRKAKEAGLFVDRFPWYLHVPDIHAINHSTPQRGGVAMAPHYLRSIEEMGGKPKKDIPLPPLTCSLHNRNIFGVFRPNPGYMQGDVQTDRQLLAYLAINRYGDCAIYTLFLGHHDFLKQNIMVLLHFEAVRTILDCNDPAFSGLKYLMYHRYFTANKGLTSWKKKVAFKPCYYVNIGDI